MRLLTLELLTIEFNLKCSLASILFTANYTRLTRAVENKPHTAAFAQRDISKLMRVSDAKNSLWCLWDIISWYQIIALSSNVVIKTCNDNIPILSCGGLWITKVPHFAHTKFGENPLIYSLSPRKRKYGWTTDGHTGDQPETIIPRHYRVAGY